MPLIRIGLSYVPKVFTANSLAGVGAASISVDPIAMIGEALGLSSAATP